MAEAGPISLTFLSTGTVRIRQAMLHQPIENRSVLLRRYRCLVDQNWTKPMPIGTFLISHPAGPILFDTGESPCCNDKGFYPFYSPTTYFSRSEVSAEEGIVHQLRASGVEPSDLQAIVLSHLHGDHAGGLEDLVREAPNVPILVNPQHWDAFGNSPVSATLAGCNPQRWPPGFSPTGMTFENHAIGPWSRSCKITSDGKILAVETPGHVQGHISLVVEGRDHAGACTTYFLTADATYGIELLDLEEPDGVNDDPETALRSLKLIKEFARQRELVVLPSHDPETPKLLKEGIIYKPKE